MEQVYVKEGLPASAEAVWQLIRDFHDISAWASSGRILETNGDGVGAVRHVQTPLGLAVERCEMHDEQGREFSYALLESPWPLKNYVATVKVSPASESQCDIEWSSQYDAPPGMSLKEEVEKMYRHSFINTLRKTLSARA
jgi:hypothetical protein